MSAVEFLQQLLRIDTTNPPGNEGPAAELLESRLRESGFKTDILTSPEGRPSLVARLEGPRDRPALVLLSHTDVVGVEADRWTHDPFGGEIADGYIWGRGALDMKNIAVMHVEAARAVASAEADPAREVIVVSVADEEAMGAQGANWLLAEHAEDVGFGDGRPPPEVLGEGAYGLTGIIDRPLMLIAVGEKSGLWIELVASGDPGHGSLPPKRVATRNLATMINEIPAFGPPRIHPVMREQFEAMAAASSGALSKVFQVLASPAGGVAARALAPRLRANVALAALLSDTASPTRIEAGYKHNVVPGQATGSFDMRLLPDTDPDEVLAGLRAKGGRRGVAVNEISRSGGPVCAKTALFHLLEEASRGLPSAPVVTPTLCPGLTDVRFFRELGATGYGWCPVQLTPELLGTIHGHDERIAVDAFEAAVATTTEVVLKAAT